MPHVYLHVPSGKIFTRIQTFSLFLSFSSIYTCSPRLSKSRLHLFTVKHDSPQTSLHVALLFPPLCYIVLQYSVYSSTQKYLRIIFPPTYTCAYLYVHTRKVHHIVLYLPFHYIPRARNLLFQPAAKSRVNMRTINLGIAAEGALVCVFVHTREGYKSAASCMHFIIILYNTYSGYISYELLH